LGRPGAHTTLEGKYEKRILNVPLLQLTNVVKDFGKLQAVSHLDLSIEKGQIPIRRWPKPTWERRRSDAA
jgi:hypothetical protein